MSLFLLLFAQLIWAALHLSCVNCVVLAQLTPWPLHSVVLGSLYMAPVPPLGIVIAMARLQIGLLVLGCREKNSIFTV